MERASGGSSGGELHKTLAVAERLTERSLQLLRELQTIQRTSGPTTSALRKEADALVRRWITYVVAAGGADRAFLGLILPGQDDDGIEPPEKRVDRSRAARRLGRKAPD